MQTRASLRIDSLSRPGFGPFSFIIEPGACCAVTGRSGAGKSVLLRMIADLDPNEGTVRLGEIERRGVPAPRWRRMVTYVPAESGWWAETVGDHFTEGSSLARELAALRLPTDSLGWPVARLSTGERQRLAFLRALSQRPCALLLDEPTSGLDRESTAGVESLLREHLQAGGILVLVSHDPEQVQRLSRQRVHIEHGQPFKEPS